MRERQKIKKGNVCMSLLHQYPETLYESVCCDAQPLGEIDDAGIPIGQCSACHMDTAFRAYHRIFLQDVPLDTTTYRADFRAGHFTGFSAITAVNRSNWEYLCGDENSGFGSTYHGHPKTYVYMPQEIY